MLFQNNFALPMGRDSNSADAGSDAKVSWGAALAEAATDSAPFPLISARESQDSGQRASVRRTLSFDTVNGLTQRAGTAGVSTAEYVFGVYLFVLSRMTGAAGACATLRGIGDFDGPVPVFVRPDPERCFSAFAQSVRDRMAEVCDHDRFSRHDIAAASGVDPRFGFAWVAHRGAEDGLDDPATPGPLALNLVCLAGPDGMSLVASHPDTPVAAERASILVDHVTDLLGRETLPERSPLKALALQGPDLGGARRPDPGAIAGVALSQAVSEIAAAYPQVTAISAIDQSWSYADLERDVARLAEALAKAGVGAGTRVALHIPRSGALVVGMLAINRLDGIFAVFDPEYPDARLEAMDAVFQAEVVLQPSEEPSWGIALSQGALDILPGAGSANDHAPAEARYALFTSGTTGQPKCVLASGAGLIGFLLQHIVDHGAGPGTRTALIGGLGHDPFLRDVFVPLMSGGTLHLPPAGFRQDPRLLADWLRDREITILHMTPQMSKLIRLGANGRAFPALEHLFWGGDVLTAADAEAFLALAPNATGTVIYGTTETPQAASMMRLETPLNWTSCPVGTGVNGRVLRLEVDGRPCGYGEPGEIMVEGDDLALGYYDAKAGLMPFGRGVGARRFETRDLGFYLPSGDVAFIGRADQQVKIRGFRVEPAEIVQLLERQPGVARAVVIAETGPTGENRLVGYVEGEGADEAGLIAACRHELPDYMVPAGVFGLEQIPLTPNGKLDRAALPRLDARDVDLTDADKPRGADEQALVAAIAVALNRESVPISKSVRQIGVDSLSFIEVSILLEDRIGALPERWEEIPLRELLAREPDGSTGFWPKSWVGLDLTVLLRVISIAFVVLTHAAFWMPAATSTLFVVSGFAFAKFQRPTILETGNTGAVWSMIFKFAIPAALWLFLTDMIHGYHWWPDYFLIGTLFQDASNPHYTLWFLDFLAATLVMLALLHKGVHRYRKTRGYAPLPARSFGFDIVAFFSATVLGYAQVLTGVWDGGLGTGGTGPFRALPLMALGILIFSADTRAKQLIASALVLLTGTLHWTGIHELMGPFDTNNGFLVVSLLGMVWIKRIRVPKLMRTPLTIVASSTLFIYIVNYAVVTRLNSHGFGWVPLQLGAALAVGVAVKYGWDWVTRLTLSFKLRMPEMRTA